MLGGVNPIPLRCCARRCVGVSENVQVFFRLRTDVRARALGRGAQERRLGGFTDIQRAM